MERLKGQPAADPQLALVRELVEAQPRHASDPFMKARVRARLRERRSPVRARRLRPIGILAMLVVLGIFSAASAMIARALLHRGHPKLEPETAHALPAAPIAPPAITRIATAPAPITTHEVARMTTPRSGGERPTRSSHALDEAKPILAEVAAPQPLPAPTVAVASAEESALLAEAFTAVRREHAPDRALALVDTYLSRYPRGALVAEALELGMEAARSSDHKKARALAERYVAAFPDGRYGEQARHILSQPQ